MANTKQNYKTVWLYAVLCKSLNSFWSSSGYVQMSTFKYLKDAEADVKKRTKYGTCKIERRKYLLPNY